MSRSSFLCGAALILGAACLFGAGSPRAAETPAGPQATVEVFDAALLAAMRQAGTLGPQGRYASLEPSMAQAFDMTAMIEKTLKTRWKYLTEDQRTRLVAAFSRFETAQYAAWFDTFTGQSFQVGSARPAPDGGVMVSSVMTGGGGPVLSLDYVVAAGADGSWKIVDVRYAGWMSDVERRSSEFTDIVARLGVEELIARLDAGSQSTLSRGDNHAAPHLLQFRTELWSVPLPAID